MGPLLSGSLSLGIDFFAARYRNWKLYLLFPSRGEIDKFNASFEWAEKVRGAERERRLITKSLGEEILVARRKKEGGGYFGAAVTVHFFVSSAVF